MLTANAALDEKELPVGRIFAGSHSGTMIGALLSRGMARGIGFAGAVSVGNEVDLSLGDICAATLDDPDIDGYMLFLETLRHADRLRAFALAAAARGKPVLAYKLGRSAAARELARHPHRRARRRGRRGGCLSGRLRHRPGRDLRGADRRPAAARPRAGRVRADARPPPVAVVTTTAGGAATVVDPLATRGITIEPAEPRHLCAARRRRHQGRQGAHRRSHHRGRALRGGEGHARHPR